MYVYSYEQAHHRVSMQLYWPRCSNYALSMYCKVLKLRLQMCIVLLAFLSHLKSRGQWDNLVRKDARLEDSKSIKSGTRQAPRVLSQLYQITNLTIY